MLIAECFVAYITGHIFLALSSLVYSTDCFNDRNKNIVPECLLENI